MLILRGTREEVIEVTDIPRLQDYIKEELNVTSVNLTGDMDGYGVSLTAQPDHKVLGTKCKDMFKDVMKRVKGLTDSEIKELRAVGKSV